MTDKRWAKAVEEHEQILIALENRNGSQLAKILRKHLKSKFETVRDWLLEDDSSNTQTQ
jgi:DNA-binding GntR family transcriptional regulator